MTTEGGEQRKGDAVPAPVPAASFFVDLCAWQEFPVGLFACFHVTVSALVALAIAAAMLNKGGACHHIGQSQVSQQPHSCMPLLFILLKFC
jgi:hypothetical protein